MPCKNTVKEWNVRCGSKKLHAFLSNVCSYWGKGSILLFAFVGNVLTTIANYLSVGDRTSFVCWHDNQTGPKHSCIMKGVLRVVIWIILMNVKSSFREAWLSFRMVSWSEICTRSVLILTEKQMIVCWKTSVLIRSMLWTTSTWRRRKQWKSGLLATVSRSQSISRVSWDILSCLIPGFSSPWLTEPRLRLVGAKRELIARRSFF